DSASRPSAPLPANRSSTRAPGSIGCNQLNSVSRTRSGVGRRPWRSATGRRVPRQCPPMIRTTPAWPWPGRVAVRAGRLRFIGTSVGPVLPCAPFCAMVPTMVSFFRRKKPDPAAPAADAPPPPPAAAPVEAPVVAAVNEVPAGPAEAPAAPAGAAGWRERLRGSGFARSLGGLFSRNPRLDEALLEEIE